MDGKHRMRAWRLLDEKDQPAWEEFKKLWSKLNTAMLRLEKEPWMHDEFDDVFVRKVKLEINPAWLESIDVILKDMGPDFQVHRLDLIEVSNEAK